MECLRYRVLPSVVAARSAAYPAPWGSEPRPPRPLLFPSLHRVLLSLRHSRRSISALAVRFGHGSRRALQTPLRRRRSLCLEGCAQGPCLATVLLCGSTAFLGCFLSLTEVIETVDGSDSPCNLWSRHVCAIKDTCQWPQCVIPGPQSQAQGMVCSRLTCAVLHKEVCLHNR